MAVEYLELKEPATKINYLLLIYVFAVQSIAIPFHSIQFYLLCHFEALMAFSGINLSNTNVIVQFIVRIYTWKIISNEKKKPERNQTKRSKMAQVQVYNLLNVIETNFKKNRTNSDS